MKPIGVTRPIDNLGRIVIPKELRKNLDLNVGDSVEFFTSGDKIVLRKYQPADIFTGEMEDLIEFNGKKVSRATIRELCKLAGFEITGVINEFDIDTNIDDI